MKTKLIKLGAATVLGGLLLIFTSGPANAMEQRAARGVGDDATIAPTSVDSYGYDSDSDTSASARNAGRGSVAVNSAGDGTADQNADQARTDTSSRTVDENKSRTDSHSSENSHNNTVYRDSHAFPQP